MRNNPLTVAWISFFPIEWLDDIPERLRSLPRQHPASWQRVLLAELEKRSDIRLHILVLRKHFARSESFERNGVTFHLVKTMGGLRAPSLFWTDTLLIRRVLKRIQPDVVHAWGTESGAAMVATRLSYPSLVTVQGLLTWLAATIPLDTYMRFTALLEDWSLRRASVVTTESSFAIRYLKNRYPNLELHQVEHAPLRLFHEVRRDPQIDPLRFLFVGSFSFLKGGDMLLEALDQFKCERNFELTCVGHVDTSFTDSLRAKVSPELWAGVRFTGSLNANQIGAELSKATMMIYPTRCDNSPNAVKEAVVAGVPVVASAIGGVVDYVFPGLNGFTFEAGNLDAFVSALRMAASHPTMSRGLVDAHCLAQMRQYLSPAKMSENFFNAYRRVLSKPS